MTDVLLSTADQMEALSRVYVKALAARAGYSTSVPMPDRDSVDLCIQTGGPRRPALDLQLKATTTLGEPKGGVLRFRVSTKNYGDLSEDAQTPRLLVVLDLPEDRSRWVTVRREELVLRRRAYWVRLRRRSDLAGRATITVRIPEANVLDVDTLRQLMEQSRRGEL